MQDSVLNVKQKEKKVGKNKINFLLFFSICFLSCLIDQISKFHFKRVLLKNNGNIDIFKFFSLTFVKNYGILFGFLNGENFRIFIIFFSLVAIFLIFLFVLRLKKLEPYYQFSLGLIEGGIIGNLIDRIRFGYVFDFINFHFWPVFNFADSFIMIGVILFFIKQIRT